MNKYIIVRHGQTEWNLHGQIQGHGDSPLTQKGITQAKELGESLKDRKIDLAFSSDLKRAYDTAVYATEHHDLEVVKTTKLREMGFGEWEGKQMDEIMEKYPQIYRDWRNIPHLTQIPGGEKLSDIKERVDSLFEELNSKYDGKTILIVTHAIACKVMLLSLLNSGMENIYRIFLDNTAISEVEFRDYGPVVTKINDTSHIKTQGKTLVNSALE